MSIVNDTTAYAVGEVYGYDSLGNVDQQPYNFATWNGRTWVAQKVPYMYMVQPFYGPLQTLWAFSPTNIWLGVGNMIHWDGKNFNPIQMPSDAWGPYGMYKIWGYGDEFYVVGDSGKIAHWNGSTWEKVESPATLLLWDIWGAVDPSTGQKTILAVGSQRAGGNGMCVLEINGLTAKIIDDSGMYPGEVGVWLAPGGPYYIVGNSVYEKSSLMSAGWKSIASLTPDFTEAVRGTAKNNIFIVGDFGTVLHFNGLTWKNYLNDASFPNVQGALWLSLAMKGNTVIAVGEVGNKAAILVGTRIQ